MARKRSSASGLVFLFFCALIIGLVTKYYVVFLVAGALALIVWIIKKSSGPQKIIPTPAKAETIPSIRVTISSGEYFPDYVAKSVNGSEYWIPSGKSAKVNAIDIGGMIYVGQGLESVAGGRPEPALIDPKLLISAEMGDYRIRHLSYWPSYWGAIPEARAAFLRWLASDRADPEADIGYVFLYFYGIERRTLHDAKSDIKAQAEIPYLTQEVERLLRVYKNSASFQTYAGSLRDLLTAQEGIERLFKKNPPELLTERYLTFKHKLGLAQCAADASPLPGEWAYAWLTGDPNTYLRTAATRCPEEFKKLFIHRYNDKYGNGMVLPRNKTRLSLHHRVASPTFSYRGIEHKKDFDLPDVSILTGPLNDLRNVADQCCLELDKFSRIIGRDRENEHTFNATVELPLVLWPDNYRQSFEKLSELVKVDNDPHIMTFRQFVASFPEWHETTKQSLQALSRSLEDYGIGMEPDIRYGGPVPAADSNVALFKCEKGSAKPLLENRYIAAALTMRLAASVAFADGHASDLEKGLLRKQIASWPNLIETERIRLVAYLSLLLLEPPSLAGLKKQIEHLDNAAREVIANFLSVVALVDATIDAKEIKALEKIFRLLGLDTQVIYSKVHLGATDPISVVQPAVGISGYEIPRPTEKERRPSVILNAEKVALLQSDSERVAQVLGQVFAQEPLELEASDSPGADSSVVDDSAVCVMGLNADQSAFLKVLITRTQWSRSEIEEIAEDRKILLDGAIEGINDRSFALYDKALLEGENPIVLDPDVVKEVLK